MHIFAKKKYLNLTQHKGKEPLKVITLASLMSRLFDRYYTLGKGKMK